MAKLMQSLTLEKLMARLSCEYNAKIVFGDAISRAQITVIPVAKVQYGWGYGIGRAINSQGEGGGCGVNVKPVGFIEISDNKATYKRIQNASFFSIAAFSLLSAFMILKLSSKPIK